MHYKDINLSNRQAWLRQALANLQAGTRILDAGAGELQNRPFCAHLSYVSQDFCQYDGSNPSHGGLHGDWNTANIDLVCDICSIPEHNNSFGAILCSEVLEHLPDPLAALGEFRRLLAPSGHLILTAPFSSLVHMAPYHYCTGFSRYWYEYHLPRFGFRIAELSPNGDWFDYCFQETARLGSTARAYGDWAWPFGYAIGLMSIAYSRLRSGKKAADLACFGWNCVAIKE